MKQRDSVLVFSSDGGRQKVSESAKDWIVHPSPLKTRLEKNGRGGKNVTVVFHLVFDEQGARNHLKSMQQRFGCGGTIKDQTIELRGDLVEKVLAYFTEQGIKIVRAGG